VYNELCKCDIQFGCWFHSHHHSFSRAKEAHHHDETDKRKYVVAELLETERNYVEALRTINLVRIPRSFVFNHAAIPDPSSCSAQQRVSHARRHQPRVSQH
jgi:hypothetical protein